MSRPTVLNISIAVPTTWKIRMTLASASVSSLKAEHRRAGWRAPRGTGNRSARAERRPAAAYLVAMIRPSIAPPNRQAQACFRPNTRNSTSAPESPRAGSRSSTPCAAASIRASSDVKRFKRRRRDDGAEEAGEIVGDEIDVVLVGRVPLPDLGEGRLEIAAARSARWSCRATSAPRGCAPDPRTSPRSGRPPRRVRANRS